MATPTFILAALEHDSLGSSSDIKVMTLPAFTVAAEFYINTMASAAIAAPVDLSIGPVDKSSNHAASEEQTTHLVGRWTLWKMVIAYANGNFKGRVQYIARGL